MQKACEYLEDAQGQLESTTKRLWDLKHTIDMPPKSNERIGHIIAGIDATYRQLEHYRLQLTELIGS